MSVIIVEKCGHISSVASVRVSTQSTNPQIDIELASKFKTLSLGIMNNQ